MSFRSPEALFRARTLAIVGASERAKWPSTIWNSLKDADFPGKVFPVNPRRDEVFGTRCYPDLAALPEPADLALVIVPGPAVQGVLETGVAAGLKAAIIYAGHMGEGTDPGSIARGEALRRLIDDSGLSVIGPNCMGGIATRERLMVYPNARIARPEPGSVAAIFQSGGTLQFWVQTAQDRGLRFSYAFSSGNELGLDLADYIAYLADDPQTRQIVLFIEGIRRPEVFRAAAAKALAAGKPIFAIKTGRTERSRAAAQSHTGAVGGDFEAFRAMCERYGIIHCPTLDHMTEMVLAFQQPRLPQGPRIGFVTTSGGTVDLMYDYVEDADAVMEPFAPETVARLKPLMPAEMTPQNPLDAGIPAGNDILASLCTAVLDDPSVDMLAFAGQISRGRADIEGAAPLAALLDHPSGKPVLAFGRMRYAMDEQGIAYQKALGIPHLQGIPESLEALKALAFYAARAGRRVESPGPRPSFGGRIEEAALISRLEEHGVTPPRSRLCRDGEAAALAAEEIGFPVVLKIIAPAFSHKTEIGGVLLSLKDSDAVREGAATLEHRLRSLEPEAAIEGFLVQEMVSGVEMLVGCREDPLHGPLIVLGSGGVLVELMRDVVVRLLPITPDDVRDMLAALRGRKLLEGFRGAPPCDVEALIRAVVGLGEVFLAHRDRLDDLEINPLIVRPEGQGIRAVDIRPIPRTSGG